MPVNDQQNSNSVPTTINSNTTNTVSTDTTATEVQATSTPYYKDNEYPGLRNIFKNEFYNSNPIPIWCFTVNFILNGDNDKNGQEAATIKEHLLQTELSKIGLNIDLLSKAVINGTLDKRTMNSVPAYYAGLSMELPSRAQNNGQIILTFNESTDLNGISMPVTRILEKMMSLVYDQEYANGTSHYRTANGLAPYDIVFKVFKPNYAHFSETTDVNTANNNSPLIYYHYYNCWVTDISDVKVDYNDENTVITRTATFKYAYMRVYYDEKNSSSK